MTKYRILHCLIFLLMLLAYIFMENDYIPLILLTYLFVMLVDAIIFIIIRMSVKVRVRCKENVLVRGDSIRIYLDIANKSIFAVPNCSIRIMYKYKDSKKYIKKNVGFFIRAKENKTIDFDIECKHCGYVSLKVKHVIIEDYFAFFAMKIKGLVLPEIMVTPKPIVTDAVTVIKNDAQMIESDEFSQNKPGDDPLEIFGIREYQDGDRINRIHWKLTTKMQEYIIKEFSLPIKTTDIILIENCESSKDILDELYEAALSIAINFEAAEIIHRIGYYDGSKGSIVIERIDKLEEISSVIGEIYKTKPYNKPVLLELYDSVVDDSEKGNIYYVTAKLDSTMLEMIANLSDKVYLTIIYVGNALDNEQLYSQCKALDVMVVNWRGYFEE